jgi:DnaJ family protein A protein 2
MGNMFGGMGGMGGRRRQEDCVVEQYVKLEEIFTNKKIPVKYKQQVFCGTCNGNGSKDGKTNECKGCNGNGQKIRIIKQGNMIQKFMSPCEDCGGSGEKVVKDNMCPDCFGNKTQIKEKTFELQLNKKLSNNDKIVVEQMGHQLKTGKTNLVIIIKEQPHPVFKRRGNNLHFDMKLRLFQSVYGFSKVITHLDGRNIVLKHDKMLSHMNTTMVVKGEGMNSNGDLYINIYTHMPKLDRLDEQENNILKKLMVKMHLSEYVKDQNVSKNEEKLQIFNMTEIETQNENSHEHAHEHEDNNMKGDEMPAQCVQQ